MKFKLKESLGYIQYTLYPSYDGAGEVDWEYEPTTQEEDNFADTIVNHYSKEELEEILKDALSPDYTNMSFEDQQEDIKVAVRDNLDLFGEDAYDYFYDNAVADYEEQADYGEDNGSGMSYRDFI